MSAIAFLPRSLLDLILETPTVRGLCRRLARGGRSAFVSFSRRASAPGPAGRPGVLQQPHQLRGRRLHQAQQLRAQLGQAGHGGRAPSRPVPRRASACPTPRRPDQPAARVVLGEVDQHLGQHDRIGRSVRGHAGGALELGAQLPRSGVSCAARSARRVLHHAVGATPARAHLAPELGRPRSRCRPRKSTTIACGELAELLVQIVCIGALPSRCDSWFSFTRSGPRTRARPRPPARSTRHARDPWWTTARST